MGYKSRGFFVSCCVRFECLNRDKKCEQCIRYSEYEPKEKRDDSPKE